MSNPLVREHQQEKLLTALRRARGAEVTYDELREAGVEYPASTVSELQTAGVAVERRYSGTPPQPAFRLEPTPAPPSEIDDAPWWGLAEDRFDPGPTEEVEVGGVEGLPEAPARLGPALAGAGSALGGLGAGLAGLALRLREAATASAKTRLRQGLRAETRHPRPARPRRRFNAPALTPARLLSGAALLAAVVAIAVLTLSPLELGAPPHQLAARRPSTRTSTAHRAVPHQKALTVRQAGHHLRRAAPRAVAAVSAPPRAPATRLEAQGHSLLQQGQYATAIPVLQQAIRATGESTSSCAQPTSQNCLTYAYALYDLGRALRLSGNAAAAIPVLQQRLQINNQPGAVAAELALAQGNASRSGTATQLEAQGHSLLQSGQYSDAIPVLQQAVQRTGESPGACAQPTSQSCLTYAFALYDLGEALRLSGQPAAAVPILRQRLEINNQRQAVAEVLQLAQNATH